ncbi:MAG: hypothetical protein WCB48_08820 [Casimicrobiaceae bacterium]
MLKPGARALTLLLGALIAIVPRAIARDLYTGEKAAHLLSLMGMVLGIAPIVAPITRWRWSRRCSRSWWH